MEAAEIERVLDRTERALAEGGRVDLRSLGFWRAVEAAKQRSDLRERFAERIGTIDRLAFLARAPIVLPAGLGIFLLVFGTVVGAALLLYSLVRQPDFAGITVLIGTLALIGATHDLAHVLVGKANGIRFTHFYSAGLPLPQPGMKIDYASYLRASPTARAWMHASGALVSKLIPFVALPFAIGAGAPSWTIAVLLAIAIGSIVTDIAFSTRASDWKRFRREMRNARAER